MVRVLSDQILDLFLPHLASVTVEDLRLVGAVVTITASTTGATAQCPDCGTSTRRVHDRYRRRLADVAVGGRPVTIYLTVRRFRCEVGSCPRRTFAEQVEGLTFRHGRRSQLQQAMLAAIGRFLAGRAGARLAGMLHCRVSPNTLLSRVRALPAEPPEMSPRVLGVDDFALKRGHVYGTVLIDIEAGRPVDVLPDRTAETLTAWLQQHPGAEIVCRDRASAYAEAVRTAAPDAVQVADRFHLWLNLCKAVEKCVVSHRSCLTPPEDEAQDQVVEPAAGPPAIEGKRAANTRRHFAVVHEMYDKGVAIDVIAKTLRMDRKTVRKYAHAATVEELLAPPRQSRRMLQPWVEYLNTRWQEGCTDSGRLFRELQQRGYRGSSRSVRRWLEPLRSSEAPTPKRSEAPTIRQVVGWLTRHPDNLTSSQQLRLKHLLARCPELAELRRHIGDFARMMKNLDGHLLPRWIKAAEGSDLPPLHNFARNLTKDLDAVTAGLTLPYSSGIVEGHVNRVKFLKRQGYGRANFDLLRRRILLTP
ncbi:ISL3 family transposase [Streptomyces sp. H27-H1]|uniref:ISL3 family transposase n=1 Tax=Streptomyces sp. H27-H1 TaxID=2996461 RepID=UPI002271F0DC|nr:ISL3 family transposase [Streptomyces sp. H27-H1]MCY0932589.1 ISL3 family transposase [Streptomyces sp. H27-H1]